MAVQLDTKANIVSKLALGKGHTSNFREHFNESEISSFLLTAQTIFANRVDSDPNSAANDGIVAGPIICEMEPVLNKDGDPQSYLLRLGNSVPSELNGEINPKTGAPYQANDRVGYILDARFGFDYTPILEDNGQRVFPLDASDWILDPFGGIVTQEADEPADLIDFGDTGTVTCYVYTGALLSDVLGISGGAGGSSIVGSYSEVIGDGSTSTFTINHNLGSTEVVVSAKNTSTNIIEYVLTEIVDDNNVRLVFSEAPSSNEYDISILGGSIGSYSALELANMKADLDTKLEISTFQALSGQGTGSIPLTAGPSLSISGGYIDVIVDNADFNIDENNGLQLANVGLGSNVYNFASITVDDKGRVISASGNTPTGTDIANTYTTIYPYVTDDYTITDVTSIVVPVISISGGFNIDPNDLVPQATRFRVQDVGNYCGTNPVTISGGAMGILNTDGGAIEFARGENSWFVIDRFENLFDRNHVAKEVYLREETDTLVANKIRSGSSATSYAEMTSGGFNVVVDGEIVSNITTEGIEAPQGTIGQVGDTVTKTVSGGDFTNVGINVLDQTSYYINDTQFVDESLGLDNTNTSQLDGPSNNGVTWTTEHIDNFLSPNGAGLYFNRAGSGTAQMVVDFGSSVKMDAFEMHSDGSPNWGIFSGDCLIFEGSNTSDTADFVNLYTPNSNFNLSQNDNHLQSMDNPSSYRWLRITSSETTNSFTGGITILSESAYKVGNEFDVNVISGEATAVSTGLFQAYDQNGTQLNDVGRLNVSYSVDGSAFTSPVDQETFKGLGNITVSDSLDLRLSLVELNTLSKIDISTPTSTINIDNTGFKYNVDGEDIFVADANGLTTTSGTFGAIGETFTKTISGGDFSNAGLNVDQGANSWGNTFSLVNVSNKVYNATTGTEPPGGAFDMWILNDAEPATIEAYARNILEEPDQSVNATAISSGQENQIQFIVDLGQQYNITELERVYKNVGNLIVYGGNSFDGTSDRTLTGDWTLLIKYSNTSGPISVDVTYRYLAFYTSSTTLANLQDDTAFRSSAASTTLNTFETIVVSGEQKTLTTGSFQAYDENGLQINDSGKLSVEYSIDGGAFTSIADQEVFKNVGAIAVTDSLTLRLTPINDTRVSKITMSSPSSTINIDNTGFKYNVDGEDIFVVDAGGLAVNTGTFGSLGETIFKRVQTGDFTNIGTNLAQESTYVENTVTFQQEPNLQTNNTNPHTVRASAIRPSWSDWEAFDGTEGTTTDGWFVQIGQDGVTNIYDEWIEIEFATQRTFSAVMVVNNGSGGASGGAANTEVKDYTIYGSNDGLVYDPLLVRTELPKNSNIVDEFDTTGAYLIYRLQPNDNHGYEGRVNVTEIKFYETVPVTNLNTIDTVMANSSEGTFVPNSFKAYDENDNLVSGNNVNIGYAVDGNPLPIGTEPIFSLINTGESIPYVITATSENATADAVWKAFDDDFATEWISANGGVPCEIIIDLDSNPQVFSAFRMAGAGTPTRAIADCTVEGSNDNANWDVLATVAGAPTRDKTTWSDLYEFSSLGNYRYYKIAITANNGNGYVACSQFEFRVPVLETQSVFRNRKNIQYTSQFDLRVQPVGTQRISYISLNTPNQTVTVGNTVSFKNDGIEYANITPEGIVTPAASIGDGVNTLSVGLSGQIQSIENGIDVATRLSSVKKQIIESTTSRTITFDDNGKVILAINPALTSIAVPSGLGLSEGQAEIEIVAMGTGGVTLTPTGGVTFDGSTDALSLVEDDKVVIRSSAQDTYLIERTIGSGGLDNLVDQGTGINGGNIPTNISSGNYPFTFGEGLSATGNFSVAFGQNNEASGDFSFSEGMRNVASGYLSHTEGDLTTASGTQSHTEGYKTTAYGRFTHAEGRGNKAVGDGSHASGYYTVATGYYSHSEGARTLASGYYSHVEGYQTTASGFASHASGRGSIAQHDYSFVWSDSATFQSTATKTFNVHAANGVHISGGDLNVYENLSVTGDISGSSFYGDGSTLTGIVTSVEGLTTSETDTNLVLKPDGVGGVAFGTSSGGSNPPLNSYNSLIGDNATQNIVLNHNLDTTDVMVSLREVSNNFIVDADIEITDANNVTIFFENIPTVGEYSVSVLGIQSYAAAASFVGTIGNGADTSITVNHALSTTNVIVSVTEVATNKKVNVTTIITDSDNCEFVFTTAPTSNEYRVMILGLT